MPSTNTIDDSLRLYLRQIGAAPVLSPDEEIAVAKRIQRARNRFRQLLLTSGYVLRRVVDLLRQLEERRVRLDHALDFPVQDSLARARIRSLLREHLPHLQELVAAQQREFARVVDQHGRLGDRLAAWHRLISQRRDAARIVARFNIRTERLIPYVQQLEQLCRRTNRLESRLAAVEHSACDADDAAALRDQLSCARQLAQDRPFTPRRRIARVQVAMQAFNQAKQTLTTANLRLVVWIAKQHRNHNVCLLDLIQQGNLALMRAVERFEPRLKHRFSSFATQWVRHAISRTIAEQEHAIRLPRQQTQQLHRLRQLIAEFWHFHGHPPSVEECAAATGIPPREVTQMLRIAQVPRSLDSAQVTRGEVPLGDYIEDDRADARQSVRRYESLKRGVAEALRELNGRERAIVQLRFGLSDGTALSLSQVGQRFELSRERVRQIEAKSLAALKCNHSLGMMMDDD